MSFSEKELLPILKAADALDGVKRRFVTLLAEKVKGRDPESVTVTQLMMELITEDHISFISDEDDRLFVVFANGEKCELPKNIATLFIKNGLKNKLYCETVLYNKHVKYMTDEEEKAVDEAKKHTRLDKKKILMVIGRLREAIKQIKDRIKTLERRSILEPETKRENDEKIDQLQLDIDIYEDNIDYLENIIKEYKRVERDKRRGKVVPVTGVSDNPDPESKTIKRENSEGKKEYEEEYDDDSGILPFVLLGGLGLGITLALGSCSVQGRKMDSNPSETEIADTDDGHVETVSDTEDIEEVEETEIDTSQLDQVVYDETFEEIVGIIQSGMMSREREDAFDGVNYDKEIMGQDHEETYDYSQVTYVEPSVDFIERVKQYKEKYQNGDPSMYSEMVEEGIKLLQEYLDLVLSNKELVKEHNETTQEAIDNGVRSYNDYYEKQKVVTVQQEEDLEMHSKRVMELIEILSGYSYIELREGIKSGKYSIDIVDQETGTIVIYNNETGSFVYSTIDSLINSKSSSVLMRALNGEGMEETIEEGVQL